MNTTTIDLDRLEALAKDTQIGGSPMQAMKLMRDFQAAANPSAILELIQLARRSQPLEAAGIKTWQERCAEKYPTITGGALAPWAKLQCATAEIADLRAALAAREGQHPATCQPPAPIGQLGCQVEGQQEPVAKCWSCEREYTAEQRLDADGNCPHCGVEIEIESLAAPVAQHSEAGARARFETWATRSGSHVTLSHVFSFTPHPNQNRYLEGTTELCWRAWQAALVSQPTEAGEIYRKVLAMPDGPQVIGPTEAGAPTAAATLTCPQCGVDRLKEPCPGMADDCAMVADAHLLDDSAGNLSGRESAAPAAPVREGVGEQDAKDAARYRWLREQSGVQGDLPLDGDVWVVQLHQPHGAIPELRCAGFGEKLDRAVDAAMQKGAQQ